MIKFCPNCGEGLEKVANFCPNCGHKIKENPNISEKDSSTYKNIICEVCGEENSAESAVCRSCGARLKNAASNENRVNIKQEKKQHFKENQPKKQTQALPEKKPLKLENAKIAIILAASAAVVFFVLLLSGVFDTKPNVNTQNRQDGQGQSSQVNLQSVQRINELEEQLKSNPKNADLLLELAHLRNDSGFNEKAIENYQQYLKIHPDDADARVDMGVCYYKERKYNEAIETMETALKYRPNHQIAHLNLGIVNLAAGNLEKSKEWLQKAYDLNPTSEIGQKAKELIESHSQ